MDKNIFSNRRHMLDQKRDNTMNAIQGIVEWTLVSECPVPNDVNYLLVEGEVAISAYRTFQDNAIFTNKRLIVRDAKNTTMNVETYSLPFSSIQMWSIANLDSNVNSSVDLWTKSGHVILHIINGIDIHKLQKRIANAILFTQV